MNPWLTIPLHDYEGHMALPNVLQNQLLSDILHGALEQYRPDSVCVLGCAGGNGFDRIPQNCRVCGIDINPAYVETARSRFGRSFADIRFLTGDIEAGIPSDVGRFDLTYAALLFEHIGAARALPNITSLVGDNGVIVVVAQLPTGQMPEISDTPYRSIYALDGFMRLVDTDTLSSQFGMYGFAETFRTHVQSEPGKHFCVLHFARTPAQTGRKDF